MEVRNLFYCCNPRMDSVKSYLEGLLKNKKLSVQVSHIHIIWTG